MPGLDGQITNPETLAPESQEPSAPPRKALVFSILAAVWIFPSAGALCIIGLDWLRWCGAASFNQALASITVEEWVAIGLLLLQAVFIAAAIYYHFHDPLPGLKIRR